MKFEFQIFRQPDSLVLSFRCAYLVYLLNRCEKHIVCLILSDYYTTYIVHSWTTGLVWRFVLHTLNLNNIFRFLCQTEQEIILFFPCGNISFLSFGPNAICEPLVASCISCWIECAL